MGKVKTEGDKVVFEDIDKEIEKAKEKKVKPKKVKEEPKVDHFAEISKDMNIVFRELTMITDWVAEMETKLNKVARRIGL